MYHESTTALDKLRTAIRMNGDKKDSQLTVYLSDDTDDENTWREVSLTDLDFYHPRAPRLNVVVYSPDYVYTKTVTGTFESYPRSPQRFAMDHTEEKSEQIELSEIRTSDDQTRSQSQSRS